MMRPWLQLAITFFVTISLLAAPCRNCQPKSQTDAGQSGHDCCPKPTPQNSEPCAWQPAAYDAVEAKSDITIDAPAVLPALAAIELPAAESIQPTILSLAQPPGPPLLTVLRS